ncbi:phage tail protein [Escherichia coli]|nr:phage tail protein [Escherichia coli]
MIYTTGTIAINGNTVKGTGTNFSEPLSLIRVGCTLIAVGNPVQIFTITEIKSGTELSVTPAANPTIAAGTKFSILLSDSISVDGLAQDVAETLRYYQGKESEIADAVEFFSDNKDVISASKLASESATTATNAATTATSAADSAKTYRDEAHEYANQTAQPYAYVLQPLPDVWMPFNDSLDMITGYSPGYKKVKIGDNVVQVASDKHVNFSRASTATYINKSGELKTAEINEPRFEKEGLLIEGQRTNYMLNSATPASWGKSANMNIAEVGTDSFGFTYGKFVCNESLIGQSTALNMAVVSTSGAVDVSGDNKCVTTSCRFKTDLELLLRIRFEAFDGSASSNLGYAIVNTRSLLVEITGVAADRLTARVNKDEAAGWIFVEATIQASEETYITSAIQYAPKSGGVVESGDYIYLATPQVENGPCASSFIISETTAATRASDMVTAPIKNNLYNLPFTVLCEVHKNWRKTPNAAPRVFETSGNQTGAAIILGFGRTTEHDGFPYCDIGGSSPRVNENASLEKMVIGMRVKANQLTCAISNGRISSETKTTWTYIKSSATICIGGKTNTGERHLFGHVRNVRVWHKALTDTQLSEIV